MLYLLTCVKSGKQVSGPMSLSYHPDDGIHERQYERPPMVGKKLRVGSFYTEHGFEESMETDFVATILSNWSLKAGNRDESLIRFRDDKGVEYIWERF